MPALNFQARFADAVFRGTKRQTIRKNRKRGQIKPGDILYMFTGMRTKHCRRIHTARCALTDPISIFGHRAVVFVSHKRLTADDVERLARADGFESSIDMMDWFNRKYGPKFEGVLIRW